MTANGNNIISITENQLHKFECNDKISLERKLEFNWKRVFGMETDKRQYYLYKRYFVMHMIWLQLLTVFVVCRSFICASHQCWLSIFPSYHTQARDFPQLHVVIIMCLKWLLNCCISSGELNLNQIHIPVKISGSFYWLSLSRFKDLTYAHTCVNCLLWLTLFY